MSGGVERDCGGQIMPLLQGDLGIFFTATVLLRLSRCRQLLSDDVLSRLNHLIESQVGRVNQHGVSRRNQWRDWTGTVALVSRAHFRQNSC